MTDASEWRGAVGAVWAGQWKRTERAFAGVAAALDATIAGLAPVSGRALDIGCGVGSTALALAAARPGLAVTGVDLSPALIDVARDRCGARPGPRFVVGDAVAEARGLAPLDLLVSRHGVMFFPDPPAAFAALRAAARPGAPLVFSCFRARAQNDWAAGVEAALGLAPPVATSSGPGPFAFSDPDYVSGLLSASGWRGSVATAVDVPWCVGTGDDPVADALAFFSRIGTGARALRDAPPPERSKMLDRLRALVETRRIDNEIRFTAAAWTWTAHAGEAA